MARDLGTKYNCFKCQTKFYDLKKPVPTCPKCGADQRDAPIIKPMSAKARAAAAAAAPKEEAEVELPEAGDDEAETEEEEEDDE